MLVVGLKYHLTAARNVGGGGGVLEVQGLWRAGVDQRRKIKGPEVLWKTETNGFFMCPPHDVPL